MSGSEKRPLVPRLRFPEFREAGEWITVELGKLSQLVTERVGSTICTPYTITSGVGLVSQEEKLGRTIAGNSLKNYIVLQKNDFAYNKSATKAYPQGFIALYTGDERAAVPNSIFTCFRVNHNQAIPAFLEELFTSNLHGKWLKTRIAVGARAHGSLQVSDDDLMATPVPLPSDNSTLAEQQKIANCLSSLDELITAEINKLDAFKTHKKGLMQQLFPREGEAVPRLRFPEFQDAEIWKELTVAEVCEINPSRANKQDDELVSFIPMAAVSEDGRIDSPEIRTYAEVKKGYTAFAENDVIVAKITPCFENGKAALAKKMRNGVGFGSTEFHVFRAGKWCLPEFLFLQLYRDSVRAVGARSMVGNAGQRRVPVSFFEELPFYLPTIGEQQYLVGFLLSLDDLIVGQAKKIEVLKNHKRGLMQKLFPILDEVSA